MLPSYRPVDWLPPHQSVEAAIARSVAIGVQIAAGFVLDGRPLTAAQGEAFARLDTAG